MRGRAVLLSITTLVAMAACSSSEDDNGDEPGDRGAQAIAEVTSLEGTPATAKERAFVADLSDMSRPYWDSGPEAMVAAYEICVGQTPSAAVFDLVDEGWSEDDADIFVDAAVKHLC